MPWWQWVYSTLLTTIRHTAYLGFCTLWQFESSRLFYTTTPRYELVWVSVWLIFWAGKFKTAHSGVWRRSQRWCRHTVSNVNSAFSLQNEKTSLFLTRRQRQQCIIALSREHEDEKNKSCCCEWLVKPNLVSHRGPQKLAWNERHHLARLVQFTVVSRLADFVYFVPNDAVAVVVYAAYTHQIQCDVWSITNRVN